jgi:hypothetical protein
MTSSRAVHPVIFPETAAAGYFVHARYGDEQFMSPEAGAFYRDSRKAPSFMAGMDSESESSVA